MICEICNVKMSANSHDWETQILSITTEPTYFLVLTLATVTGFGCQGWSTFAPRCLSQRWLGEATRVDRTSVACPFVTEILRRQDLCESSLSLACPLCYVVLFQPASVISICECPDDFTDAFLHEFVQSGFTRNLCRGHSIKSWQLLLFL